MVLKDEFKEEVKNILKDLNVHEEDILSFMLNEKGLEDIGFCDSLSCELDDRLSVIFDGYNGCCKNETLDQIWNYNEPFING